MSSYDDAMELWVKAGGSPQAAAMAAAVADASSGLNPAASFTDSEGVVHKGLWAIPTTLGALSSIDPLTNARAAIQLSDNGTDWKKWCSAWSDNDCGNSGGTYLGDGSNAQAALAQRGGAYNVIGGQGATYAVPTGVDNATYGQSDNGSSAGTTDTSAAQSSQLQTTGSHTGFLIGVGLVLLLLVIAYMYFRGKKVQQADAEDDFGPVSNS